MKALLITMFLCATLGAAAQTASTGNASHSAAPHRKSSSAVGRTECVDAVGLCVTVPTKWQRLGNIFDDLGFVVAEPHPGTDSATWPQISVAAIDVSPQKANGATPSLDSLVDTVLTPDGTYISSETQQRSRLLLNGANAEIVRVKLHDGATGTDTLEEVALIEGADGLVYSIALRCAPQDFTRLEPIFQRAAHSWRVKPRAAPAPAAGSSGAALPGAQPEQNSKPSQDTDKK